MDEPIAIRRLAAEPLDLPLRVPFGIAGGAQDVARNVLVRLELADGTLGLGEAAPFPAYNGETQAQALAALRAAEEWLRGGSGRRHGSRSGLARSRGNVSRTRGNGERRGAVRF